jgi:hypothetical protein
MVHLVLLLARRTVVAAQVLWVPEALTDVTTFRKVVGIYLMKCYCFCSLLSSLSLKSADLMLQIAGSTRQLRS